MRKEAGLAHHCLVGSDHLTEERVFSPAPKSFTVLWGKQNKPAAIQVALCCGGQEHEVRARNP